MSSRISEITFIVLWMVHSSWLEAVIDQELSDSFVKSGHVSVQNILISFTHDMQTVFIKISSQPFASDLERRIALTEAQEAFADESQANLKKFLDFHHIRYSSFWISNKVIIRDANETLVTSISEIPGVAKIEKEPVVSIDFAVLSDEDTDNHQQRHSNLSWGIERIRANHVWRTFTGRGIVVANIDTGVRHSHEALRDRWRSYYGWFDPIHLTKSPVDAYGHGTHCMGILAGSDGIGVAPEAKWISCRGCETEHCGASELYSCGQWMQCPTKPDGTERNCSLAPQIVSNSWWKNQKAESDWYDDVISAWHLASIIPVFSVGDHGPKCSTVSSPADRPKLIAVGSTNRNETISWFSGRGPAPNGRVKPDIVAPGNAIRSASNTSDTVFVKAAGTSQAAPEVGGVIALMLQKNGRLNFDQIYTAITRTTVRNSLDTSMTPPCGNSVNNVYPNNVFGYGRIDAVNSVNAVN